MKNSKETVAISIPGGKKDAFTKIELTAPTGNDIYYTDDGSDPNTSPTRRLYCSAYLLHKSVTLKTCVGSYDKNASDPESTYAEVSEEKYECSPMLINEDFKDGVWENKRGVDNNFEIDNTAFTPKKDFTQSVKATANENPQIISSNIINIDKDYNYKLTFWIKTKNMSRDNMAYITLATNEWTENDTVKVPDTSYVMEKEALFTEDTIYEGRGRLIFTKKNQDWTKYTHIIREPNEDALRIICAVEGDGSGEVWFGGFNIEPIQKDSTLVSVTPVEDLNNPGNCYALDISQNKTISNKVIFKNNLYQTGFDSKIIYEVHSVLTEKLMQTGEVEITFSHKDEEITKTLDLSGITQYGVFDIDCFYADSAGNTQLIGSYPITRVKPVREVADSIIGTTTSFGWGDGNEAGIRRHLEIIKNAGVKWIRQEILWQYVETTKGVYDFNNVRFKAADNVVRIANEIGLKVLIIICYGNILYRTGNFSSTEEAGVLGAGTLAEIRGPEAINAFSNYAAAVMERYNGTPDSIGKIDAVEVYNEWDFNCKKIYKNMWDGDPTLSTVPGYENSGYNVTQASAADYTKVLKAAYPKIKEKHPEVIVVGGVLASANAGFAQKMMEDGAIDYMDVLAMHPYTFPHSPEKGGRWHGPFEDSCERVYAKLKDEIVRAGKSDTFEVWITEYGWATNQYGNGVSEKQQAEYYVRTLALTTKLKTVDKMLFYCASNVGRDIRDCENFFGFERGWNSQIHNTPKPAYTAMSAFANMISEYQYEEDVSEFPGDIYALKFKNNDGGCMITIWEPYDSKNVRLTLSGNKSELNAKLYDTNGNELQDFEVDSKTLTTSSFVVDGSMKYLELSTGVSVVNVEVTST